MPLASFNYVPPPPEAFRSAIIAAIVLGFLLAFIRNGCAGSIVGGIGAFIITAWLYGQADGDIGSLYGILFPILFGGVGAMVGGVIGSLRQRWLFSNPKRSEHVSPEIDLGERDDSAR